MSTVGFLSQSFCYPVWLGGYPDNEFVSTTTGTTTQKPKGSSNPFTANNEQLESLLLSTEGTNSDNDGNRTGVDEQRSPSPSSRQQTNRSSKNKKGGMGLQLDDIVSKVMKQRDELLEQNKHAEKEITAIKNQNQNLQMEKENYLSENEYLKNLNAIAERMKLNQQEQLEKQHQELAKIQILAENDRMLHQEQSVELKTKIAQLEMTIKKMKNRNVDALSALDDGIFWSSSYHHHHYGERVQQQQQQQQQQCMPVPETSLLEAVYEWTLGKHVA